MQMFPFDVYSLKLSYFPSNKSLDKYEGNVLELKFVDFQLKMENPSEFLMINIFSLYLQHFAIT